MKRWLAQQLAGLPGKAKFAQTIRYALSRWSRFTAFLDDGRIELDSNTDERTIRPIALGRTNALFAGFDKGGHYWAALASLIHTAKLNGLNPQAYLADVLERIAARRVTARELPDLLPLTWQPATEGGGGNSAKPCQRAVPASLTTEWPAPCPSSPLV